MRGLLARMAPGSGCVYVCPTEVLSGGWVGGWDTTVKWFLACTLYVGGSRHAKFGRL